MVVRRLNAKGVVANVVRNAAGQVVGILVLLTENRDLINQTIYLM